MKVNDPERDMLVTVTLLIPHYGKKSQGEKLVAGLMKLLGGSLGAVVLKNYSVRNLRETDDLTGMLIPEGIQDGG